MEIKEPDNILQFKNNKPFNPEEDTTIQVKKKLVGCQHNEFYTLDPRTQAFECGKCNSPLTPSFVFTKMMHKERGMIEREKAIKAHEKRIDEKCRVKCKCGEFVRIK